MTYLYATEKQEFIWRVSFLMREVLRDELRRTANITIGDMEIRLQKLGGTASVVEVKVDKTMILVIWYPSAQSEWRENDHTRRLLNLLRGAMVLEDLAGQGFNESRPIWISSV